MKYQITTKHDSYSASAIVRPDGMFGGWLAVNDGTAAATVNGVTLAAGARLDFTQLNPDVIWNSDIVIVCTTGAIINLTRMYYKEI